jgi:outer membrane protein assembly factor BamD (BamD/ComL family)
MRTGNYGGFSRMRQSRGGLLRNLEKKMELGLALGLALMILAPGALGQKPPAPAPAPSPAPGPGPGRPPTNGPGNDPAIGMDPSVRRGQLGDERVMYLNGQIKTTDGSAVPFDVMVERICNERVRQQVYAGPQGAFSMQMGSKADVIADATADVDLRDMGNANDPSLGIPRRLLQNCELRASAPGFRPRVLMLMDLTVTAGTVDVGTMVVERATKVEGATLNVAAYRAPKEARKAYEKGMSAARNGKLTDAQKNLEKAVEIYPKYASAWYELGVVRQKGNEKDGARAAYTQAAEIDRKFLAPYVLLAEMAYTAKDWPEVLRLTEHIIELDPLNHANVTGYVVDLDPVNSAEAYFYNAVANYQLGRVDQAEKSALKAEHVDLLTKFPQMHLLLAEIFSDKGNYGGAIAEIETYIELVPGTKDAEVLRERMAKLEELNGTKGAAKRE